MTELKEDVDAYSGCEEPLQQLLNLSANVTSMLFGGWFGLAFFYFPNNLEEARDTRFLPSEYLTRSRLHLRRGVTARCCLSRPSLRGSCSARDR